MHGTEYQATSLPWKLSDTHPNAIETALTGDAESMIEANQEKLTDKRREQLPYTLQRKRK